MDAYFWQRFGTKIRKNGPRGARQLASVMALPLQEGHNHGTGGGREWEKEDAN